MVDLGAIYHRCTSKFPAASLASVSESDLNGIVLNINSSYETNHEQLKRTFELHESWTPNGNFLNGHNFMVSSDPEWKTRVPQMEQLADGTTAVVAPYSNGMHLSRLLRVHLLSAFLGTLARYHPEPWMVAVHGHVGGDYMTPVIRAAMDLIDAEYPRLIVLELERRM